jgi:hypothetical protein
MVILGGGVVDASETYSKAAISFALKQILKSAQKNLQITKTKLGNKAAMIGVGLLAIEQSEY